MANSKDPDEMPHHATFHRELHCLLCQNLSSEKEIYVYIFLRLLPMTPQYRQRTILM